MKKTIILKREVEENKALPIAIEEWYETKILKTIEHTWPWEIDENIFKPNPETPIEYLARINQERIDNRFAEILVNIHKRELDKKRQEEDKKLKETMKKTVWETEVDIV